MDAHFPSCNSIVLHEDFLNWKPQLKCLGEAVWNLDASTSTAAAAAAADVNEKSLDCFVAKVGSLLFVSIMITAFDQQH